MDEEQSKLMEKELRRTESIIDSMTREERTDHRILNANRRRRIARGSGTNVAEVNKLIKQYTEMRQMMRQLTSSGMFGGSGLKGKMMRKHGRHCQIWPGLLEWAARAMKCRRFHRWVRRQLGHPEKTQEEA